MVDDFDTELIVHSYCLRVLIYLPLVLLALSSLDLAVSGEIPSLELPRNLLIESGTIKGDMVARYTWAGGGGCWAKRLVVLDNFQVHLGPF